MSRPTRVGGALADVSCVASPSAEGAISPTWVGEVWKLPVEINQLMFNIRLDPLCGTGHPRRIAPDLAIRAEAGRRRSKVCRCRKKIELELIEADVDCREIQLFLFSYILVSICEIITIGGFPLSSNVRIVRHALHSIR